MKTLKKLFVGFLCVLLVIGVFPIGSLASVTHAQQESPIERILGVYDGSYTAPQGITGLTLSIHKTQELLANNYLLQKYTDVANLCGASPDDGISDRFNVKDIKSIISQHTGEYIALFNFFPMRDKDTGEIINPNVEEGLYTMTVSYNESKGTYEFYGSQWIQHDTYAFADLKNIALSDDMLSGDVYGKYTSWFWTQYGDVGDVTVSRGYGHSGYRIDFEDDTVAVGVDEKLEIESFVTDNHGVPVKDGFNINWFSSDETIAQIRAGDKDGNNLDCRIGTIIGISEGTTEIYAVLDNYRVATCTVVVGKPVYLPSKVCLNHAVYSDSYFSNNSTYNHDLAWLTLCLELSSWTADESTWGDGISYDETTVTATTDDLSKSRYKCIETAYINLGFDEACFYNYDVSLNDTSDKVAFTIATKKNVCGATLISVVIRGGGYGAEWSSNFNVGDGNAYHNGFFNAAKAVYNEIVEGSAYSEISGDIKFWVTGYSRGAAVANILAAMLCDESQYSNQFNKEDIFAYTFATPQGVTNDQNASDTLYQNIYNIVNPGDIVPMVAPSSWGFTRYGQTKYFNTIRHSINYPVDEVYHRVNKEYRELTGEEFNAKFNLEQSALNMALMNVIHREFPSVTESEKIQSILQEFLEFSNTKVMSKDAFYENIRPTDFYSTLSERYGSEYFFASVAVNFFSSFDIAPSSIFDLISSTEYCRLVLILSEIHGISCLQMNHLLMRILLNVNNWNDVTAADGLFSRFRNLALGHNPEVYLSWMKQKENHTFGYKESPPTRVLSIACPVSITVYDESGVVVASIVNHEVVYADIPVLVDGEKTEIYFSAFNDENYTVEIVATDMGTMDYSITEFSFAGEIENRTNFYDVPMEAGQTFTSNIVAISEFSDDNYDLRTSGGEGEILIPADEVLSSEEKKANLNIFITGEGSVVGSGDYFKGESVNIKAYTTPGYKFDGWHMNGQLLSNETTYMICLTEDMDICATFSVCEHVWNDGKIIKEPTHTEQGEKVFICSACREVKVEVLDVLTTHSYGEWEKIDDTNHRHVCVCGEYEEENHTYGTWIVIKEPTEIQTGIREQRCVCGHSLSEVIPKFPIETAPDTSDLPIETNDTIDSSLSDSLTDENIDEPNPTESLTGEDVDTNISSSDGTISQKKMIINSIVAVGIIAIVTCLIVIKRRS